MFFTVLGLVLWSALKVNHPPRLFTEPIVSGASDVLHSSSFCLQSPLHYLKPVHCETNLCLNAHWDLVLLLETIFSDFGIKTLVSSSFSPFHTKF